MSVCACTYPQVFSAAPPPLLLQEFPEDNERLFQYISDLDYKEGGVAPVKIGGVADGSSEEDSDVEDEREPSQPFAFKIHYADSSVPSVWIHHASELPIPHPQPNTLSI